MPLIKIQHISSASSENPSHPADNLLVLEGHKKWCCATAGEAKAIVVMQLEKSCQIHSVDIGNNGAAFVELLVGRSTAPDHYEPLVAMTSFMTPKESRQWGNINKVKIFARESFCKEAADQKWDRVKLVCTQPYNKTEKYGLSFVQLQSPPDEPKSTASDKATSKSPAKLGAFSLRDDPKDLPPGTMFYRKPEKTTPPPAPPMSAAAEARKASADALSSLATASSPPTSTTTTEIGSQLGYKRKLDGSTAGKGVVVKGETKKRASPKASRDSPPSKKPKVESIPEKKPAQRAPEKRPFSKLLEGAVFVLSGFKNPFRAELREKGVEMGALYQADWDPSCTHLVCAFPNTPKFNQVKGKGGLIVSKDWLLHCHSKKTRLPARKYQLSAGDGSATDGDYYDTKEAAIFTAIKTDTSEGAKGQSSSGGQSSSKRPEAPCDDTQRASEKGGTVSEGQRSGGGGVAKADEGVASLEDLYGASTDEDSDSEVVKSKHEAVDSMDVAEKESSLDSACDTEDEVERIREQEKLKAGQSPAAIVDSTGPSSHTPKAPKRSLLNLPCFLSKVTVFLYGTFSGADRRMLLRYITAYGGQSVDYMDDSVTHVITQQQWDDNFDQALADNSTLAFVRPRWIFACHQKQQCVPHQPFVVAPS